MQQNKPMTLHLQQEILYQEAPFSASDAQQAYQKMLAYLDSQQVGTEGCLALSSTFQLLFAGIQQSPDEATRIAVERAFPQPKADSAYQIEVGTYTFLQCAPQEVLENFKPYIPNLFDGPNRIFLRLIKENALTIIAQIWIAG